MAYTAEQRHNIDTSKRIARQRGASPRVTKALLEAESVESSYRNLNRGDRDSKGILQQRPSQGWGSPGSVEQDVNDFLDRAIRVNKSFKGSAGQLAQAIQRSAFPGRYDQHSNEARHLLDSGNKGRSVSTAVSTAGTTPGSTTANTTASMNYTPGVDNSEQRHALIAGYFANRGQPGALLDLIVGMKSSQDTPGQYDTSYNTSYKSTAARAITSPAATDKASQYKAAADMLAAAHMPYKWGGGHGAKLNLLKGSKVIPVDCSGAVSAVLGINPRVAAQFKGWGKAGRGKTVTVWAAKDGSHVLMEINGHFFGTHTSKANPKGGAGWIPRSAISSEYLSRFVARHPAGL